MVEVGFGMGPGVNQHKSNLIQCLPPACPNSNALPKKMFFWSSTCFLYGHHITSHAFCMGEVSVSSAITRYVSRLTLNSHTAFFGKTNSPVWGKCAPLPHQPRPRWWLYCTFPVWENAVLKLRKQTRSSSSLKREFRPFWVRLSDSDSLESRRRLLFFHLRVRERDETRDESTVSRTFRVLR